MSLIEFGSLRIGEINAHSAILTKNQFRNQLFYQRQSSTANGSVRFLSDQINIREFAKLVTRRGGEQVSLDGQLR